MILPSDIKTPPIANPVIAADIPSPMYFELQHRKPWAPAEDNQGLVCRAANRWKAQLASQRQHCLPDTGHTHTVVRQYLPVGKFGSEGHIQDEREYQHPCTTMLQLGTVAIENILVSLK